MRKLLLALAIAGLIVVSLGAQQAVVKKNVNLRETPSAQQEALRLLKPPEALTLLEPNPTEGYYRVRTDQNEEGWVWDRNIKFSAPDLKTFDAAKKSGPYAIKNASCPPVGKRLDKAIGKLKKLPAKSDGGLRNMAKRHIPPSGTPKTLELADFKALQADVNKVTHENAADQKTAFEPNRDALLGLDTPSGAVSEGGLVQITAFVIRTRPQGNESVNCAGADGTDIHINVGAKGTDEEDGIDVEMIPQLPRPAGWNKTTLDRLHDKALPVLVIGGLTYDNEHFVNKDRKHPKAGQPWRFSLWEIHPITQFYVCEKANCSSAQHSDWTALEEWAKKNPK